MSAVSSMSAPLRAVHWHDAQYSRTVNFVIRGALFLLLPAPPLASRGLLAPRGERRTLLLLEVLAILLLRGGRVGERGLY